jgi:hypothetical protein
MKRCPQCNGALEPTIVGRLSASDSPVTLDVFGLPAKRCAKGHASPFDEDFMLWLIAELKERAAAIDGASEKGTFFFKKYLCPCGKQLGSLPAGTAAYPWQLAYDGASPFRAELQLPLYRCDGCGRELVRSTREAQKHISLAVAKLNDAAGFPHSA